MPRLYKRGNIWWYQFGNQRFSTRRTDKKAAELVAREWERITADPTYEATNKATLAQCLEDFIAFQRVRGRAEGTIQMNQKHAGHLNRLLDAGGDVNLVSAATVDRYIVTRDGEGASSSTIHKELSTLRGCLKHAGRHGHYRRNLIQVMPQGMDREYVPRKTYLTLAQLGRLRKQLPEDRAARVAFIVATSARLSESDRAQPEDVTDDEVHLRGTKTEKSDRRVPRIAMFAKLLEESVPHLPFRHWGNIRRDLAQACAKAKVPRVTPNDLRRTTATLLRQAGVHPSLIAQVMGHGDSRMVERVYGRIDAKELGSAISSAIAERSPTVHETEKGAKTP